MDVSIVIVSYNTAAILHQCLRSVQSSLSISPELTSEIWVVDNASSDDSAELVGKEFPDIHLIANKENRGFGAANNQAIAEAQGRYILILNPDTEVRSSAIGKLVRYLDEHPTVGLVGGRLVYPDGSFQHSCFHFPTLLMTLFDFFPINHRFTDSRFNGRYPKSWYERPFVIDHPLGACMLVRKEVLEQVGTFDERFFIYCEEVDLCIRVKKTGWAIHCVPSAEIVHHSAKSTSQFRGRMLVELHRSRVQLFNKHYNSAFRWANRRLIRLGARTEINRARQALRAGAMSAEEANERIEAYETIAKL